MEFVKDIKKINYLVKIVLLGECATGKTFFVNRINNDCKYFESIKENLQLNFNGAFDFISRIIKFKNRIFKVQIWHPSGARDKELGVKLLLKRSFAILLFYDGFDKKTFERVKALYEENYPRYKDVIFILIRNKYDKSLKPEEECKDFISDEKVLEYADKNNIFFKHLSIFEKYDTGINNIIEFILNKYIQRNVE